MGCGTPVVRKACRYDAATEQNETLNVRSLALKLNVGLGRASEPQRAVQVEYRGRHALYLARQGAPSEGIWLA